MISVIAVNM